jgi:hypothetical protein
MREGSRYLTRVGVDHSDVLLALVSLDHNLLHVDPNLLHPLRPKFNVDQVQELLDVPQQLL